MRLVKAIDRIRLLPNADVNCNYKQGRAAVSRQLASLPGRVDREDVVATLRFLGAM